MGERILSARDCRGKARRYCCANEKAIRLRHHPRRERPEDAPGAVRPRGDRGGSEPPDLGVVGPLCVRSYRHPGRHGGVTTSARSPGAVRGGRANPSGARVFCEYCESIAGLYTAPPVTTRFERIVVASEEPRIDGLRKGDLLEDQCNTRIAPYEFVTRYGPPLLQYTRALGHDRAEAGVSAAADAAGLPISERALWFHRPAHLLICVFRLCNFSRAGSRRRPAGVPSWPSSWSGCARRPSRWTSWSQGTA